MFKITFKTEKYISVIDIDKYRKCFASFRSLTIVKWLKRVDILILIENIVIACIVNQCLRTNITLLSCVLYMQIYVHFIYHCIITNIRMLKNSSFWCQLKTNHSNVILLCLFIVQWKKDIISSNVLNNLYLDCTL
jgi:hypothetical protein